MYVGLAPVTEQAETATDDNPDDLPYLAPPPTTRENDPIQGEGADASIGTYDAVDGGITACESTCEVNEITCLSDTSRGICEDVDGDGCATWTERLCPTNARCTDGQCSDPTTASPSDNIPPISGRNNAGGDAPSVNKCANVKFARVGYNEGITNSPGNFKPKENGGCFVTDGSDDVWQFRPPQGGEFLVEVYGGFTDYVVHARSDCDNLLTEVGCVDGSGLAEGEMVMMTIEPGRTIFLIIDTYGDLLPQRYDLLISPM